MSPEEEPALSSTALFLDHNILSFFSKLPCLGNRKKFLPKVDAMKQAHSRLFGPGINTATGHANLDLQLICHYSWLLPELHAGSPCSPSTARRGSDGIIPWLPPEVSILSPYIRLSYPIITSIPLLMSVNPDPQPLARDC